MPEDAAAKPKPGRDPQALTSEYHKARKQLMLWAGILFIWELVGIDLEKAKEAGGNAGAIITAIKSPQAVPWVLLILVAYFLFKTSIEWYQCSASRRALRVSRIDFGSAWLVTLLACALYVYQAISRIQFADVVQSSNKASSLGGGLPLGFGLGVFIKLLSEGRLFGQKVTTADYWYWGFNLVLIVVAIIGLIMGWFDWRYLALGILLTAALLFLILLWVERKSGLLRKAD